MVCAIDASIVDKSHRADLPTSIFLMVNNFEVGGSERQFAVLAKNICESKFQIHLGCLERPAP